MMPNYHGYSMDFEWDRAHFMPFIQAYCFACGWIPICLSFLLFYLLFNHSPMYTKQFRNLIAAYHFTQMFYDIHHSYLFTPYPLFPMPIFICHGILCKWGAPTRLLMTFTGLVASCGSFTLTAVVFMRMRNILSLESKSRLSDRQSMVIMGFTGVFFVSNTLGMALFAGDDARKMDILNRPELMWIREKPDALVWGDMFDTPAFNIEINWLSATTIYGVFFFPGILIYSGIALRREKKKLAKVTSINRKDQGNRMLQIQLWGTTITFLGPLSLLLASVKIGFPTSNSHVHSVIRCVGMFLYINNSMVAIALHLMMNRTYQKIIVTRIKKSFGCTAPVRRNTIVLSHTSSPRPLE